MLNFRPRLPASLVKPFVSRVFKSPGKDQVNWWKILNYLPQNHPQRRMYYKGAWVFSSPHLSSWEAYHGLVECRFWRFGQWITVIVDDRLPTLNGELLYCHSNDPYSFWCALLEKAYAKLLGSYEALEGGELTDALIDFTGGLTECLDIVNPTYQMTGSGSDAKDRRRETSITPSSSYDPCSAVSVHLWKHPDACDYMFKLLSILSAKKTLIAATIRTENPDDQECETSLGLVIGHAYAVTQLYTVPYRANNTHEGDAATSACEAIHLVCLTNPWGHNTWKGAFSPESQDWKLLNPAISKPLCRVSTHGDSGRFWMCFTDFLTQFNHIVLCHAPIGHRGLFQFTPPILDTLTTFLTPKGTFSLHSTTGEGAGALIELFQPRHLEVEWSVHDAWDENGSGGCRNFSNTHLNNPQFSFQLTGETSTPVAIYLIQKTVRSTTIPDSTTGLYHIGMSVYQVENNREFRIQSTREPITIIASSTYRNSRVVWLRLDRLTKGYYVIIPTTFHPNILAEFMLRLIGPSPKACRKLLEDYPFTLRYPKHASGRARSTGPSSHCNLTTLKRFRTCLRDCFTVQRSSNNSLVSVVDTIYMTRPKSGPTCPSYESPFFRITFQQALIRPSSSAVIPLIPDASLGRDTVIKTDWTPLFRVEMKMNNPEKDIITKLHPFQRSKRSGAWGLIKFGEIFILPSEALLATEKLQIQVILHQPVFDELHSHGILDIPDRHKLNDDVLFHIPLYSPLWRRGGIRDSQKRADPSPVTPPSQLLVDADRESYHRAFDESERLLDAPKCVDSHSVGSPLVSKSSLKDDVIGLITIGLQCL